MNIFSGIRRFISSTWAKFVGLLGIKVKPRRGTKGYYGSPTPVMESAAGKFKKGKIRGHPFTARQYARIRRKRQTASKSRMTNLLKNGTRG